MVFDVFAGFGRFLQMPERFLAALQGFVIVWKGVLPKPLQHRAKAPKTFPAFAKNIQSLAKNILKNPKPLRLRQPPRVQKPSRRFCGAGKVFGVLGFLHGFERFLQMPERFLCFFGKVL